MIQNTALAVLGLSFLGIGFTCPVAAEPRPSDAFRVLLTSFDPFGQCPENNSQNVVKELSRIASSLGTGIEIDTCNLPVVYDRGASVALECVERFRPDAVISFGEEYCDIEIETAATNWDDSITRDNSGQIRKGKTILENGPKRSGFAFPIEQMYCAQRALSIPVLPTSPTVNVSADSGAFVCNNTAYLLSLELKARKTPFTFIHVPDSQCDREKKNPRAVARVIAEMLAPAIAQLRTVPGLTKALPKEMPSTRSEAEALLQDTMSLKRPVCEIEFTEKLIRAEASNASLRLPR